MLRSSHFKNFYEVREGAFLIVFSKDRKELAVYVNLARTINLTEFREKAGQPSAFAVAFRKSIDGCVVERVEQHGSDRILTVALGGRSKKRLVVEMFDKGNLLVLDEKGVIELIYRSRSFKDRELRKGVVYSFPPEKGKTEIYDDGNAQATEPRIYEKSGEYLDFAIAPVERYEKDKGVKARRFERLSALLDSLYMGERTTEVNEEKVREAEELNASLKKLREQTDNMKSRSVEYRKVASRIFERMNEINELLAHVSKSRAKSERELDSIGSIRVKKLDAKKKIVTVELD